MAKKRELNAPVYEARFTGSSDGNYDDDDIIDAEIVEDTEEAAAPGATPGGSRRSPFERVRTHGVRDSFRQKAEEGSFRKEAPASAAAREERERRAQAQRDSTEAQRIRDRQRAKVKSERNEDPVTKLRYDMMRANDSFMKSICKSGILNKGETQQTQAKKLSGMHQVYASMMVLQCVEPLKRGLNAASIVNVLGMGAAMWTMSPNFRTQVGSFGTSMREAIEQRIENRGKKKDDKAIAKYDKAEAKGKEDLLRRKWRRRLDKIEHAERGYRDPFTVESAAMVEVSLAETAYAEMRMPGAKSGEVKDRYDSARSALYGYIAEDGLNPEEVSRAMRTMVGQRMERDPGYANVFKGLGHGMYAKSAPKDIDGRQVWAGDFDSCDGTKVASGSFELREPMDTTGHRVEMSKTIFGQMASAKNEGELNDVLSQYMVGSAINGNPGLVDLAEDAATRGRMSNARTMFASMAADGLTKEQSHFAYTAAYIDAVEYAQRLNPELGAMWARTYGEDWHRQVSDKMEYYREMGEYMQEHAPAKAKSHAREGYPAGWTEEGYVDPDDVVDTEEEDIVDAEIVEDEDYEQHEHYDAAGERLSEEMRSKSTDEQKSAEVQIRRTTSQIRRARVNQHYNEIETGRIAGLGRDDSAPLQDPGFTLGG